MEIKTYTQPQKSCPGCKGMGSVGSSYCQCTETKHYLPTTTYHLPKLELALEDDELDTLDTLKK